MSRPLVTDFDPSAYGPALAPLLALAADPPLDAGRPDLAQRERLAALSVENAFAGRKVADRGLAECCVAAAWLAHNFLDEAHRIVQDVPSASGSYWHGVLHRREGDYSNAKYWFARAGAHPMEAALAADAALRSATAGLARGGAWDAAGFVDLCQRAIRSGDEGLAAGCRAAQAAEWRRLYDWCWRGAVG